MQTGADQLHGVVPVTGTARTTKRGPLALIVLGVVALVTAMAGCGIARSEASGTNVDARLVVGKGSGGLVVPRKTFGPVATALTSAVCVKGGLPVKILNVEARNPTGGLRVTDFTVWDLKGGEPPYSTFPKERLSETPAAAGSKTAKRDCDDRRYNGPAWLVVELETDSAPDEVATASGFVLSYRTGLNDRQARMRYGFSFCPLTDTAAERCEPKR